MNIQLKNISHNSRLSEETEAFTATMFIDGKKAAEVSNHGTGGSNNFHWYDHDARKQFDAFIAAQPPIPPDETYDQPLPMDGDIFVAELLAKYLELKTYKRWVKKHTQTAYRLKTDELGSFRILKEPYTPGVKAALEQSLGNNLDMIVNEFVKENE